MTRPFLALKLLLIPTLIAAMTGCHPTQPFYAHGNGDLSHYLDKAVRVEHPDLVAPPLEEVSQAREPLTISNPEFESAWDLTLQECVAITLNNSKILRGGQAVRLQNGTIFAGAGEGVFTQSPQQFQTIYNPAVVESNPGFANDLPQPDGGQANLRTGVEAALAAFDAQLQVVGNGPNGAIFSKTDRPQNVNNQFNGFPQVLRTDQGGINASITKKSAEGTTFFVRNTYETDTGNQRGQFQAFQSIWTTTLETGFTHPLLRGSGAQINRMPVMIARVGSDIELMTLNNALQDTLCNVEVRYWDLHFNYRTLETAKVGRDAALLTWRIVYAKWKQGVEPVQAEAQAREQYFAFRAQVETALRELYNSENQLRLLMGLSATDGRLIRPIDEPTLARVEFMWNEALHEATLRRPELISERWRVKQRELELVWSRNQLLPQLDVGFVYRFVGVGDDLINTEQQAPFPAAGSSAVGELTGGKYQESALTMQYAMPIGFRKELAAVRHAQLRLAREKAVLEDMELDVSHGLAMSFRNLDANYHLAQTNANRWAAAAKEVESLEDLYQSGKAALDLVLEAHRRRAVAQNAFWNSVSEYNKSIADVHCRKGSILDYNGVAFEEGPWPHKAYWDAVGLARERGASHKLDYGWTRPKVISRGELGDGFQGAVFGGASEVSPEQFTPAPGAVEVLPNDAPPMPAEEAAPAAPKADVLPPPPVQPLIQPMVPPAKPDVPAPEAKLQRIYKSAGSNNPLRDGRSVANDGFFARQVTHEEPVRVERADRSEGLPNREAAGAAPGWTRAKR